MSDVAASLAAAIQSLGGLLTAEAKPRVAVFNTSSQLLKMLLHYSDRSSGAFSVFRGSGCLGSHECSANALFMGITPVLQQA